MASLLHASVPGSIARRIRLLQPRFLATKSFDDGTIRQNQVQCVIPSAAAQSQGNIFPLTHNFVAQRWSSTEGAKKEISNVESIMEVSTTFASGGIVEDDIQNWQDTPSVLDSLPEGFSPGQAQDALDQKGAKKFGRKPIRRTEVWRLCLAARQGYHNDAACILACLKAYKRLHKTTYTDWQAKAAIEGMVRALTPVPAAAKTPNKDGFLVRYPICVDDTSSDDYYLQRIHADLFAMKAILDPSAGLVTAVHSDVVDALLADLLSSVQALSDSAKLDECEHPRWKVVRLTQKVVHALIYRHAKPERFLKKRAARKYLKQVMRNDPPHATTIHSACHICILLGSAGDADVGIISEYTNPFIWGVPMDETIALLDEARAREKEAKAEALAAAQAAAEAVEQEEEAVEVVEEAEEGEAEGSDTASTKEGTSTEIN